MRIDSNGVCTICDLDIILIMSLPAWLGMHAHNIASAVDPQKLVDKFPAPSTVLT